MGEKIPQTPAELHEHYNDQLQFLLQSAESFDRGFDGEAKRIALALRILLHDQGKNTHSLLGQIGLLTLPFVSTAIPYNPSNILTHGGLITIAMSGQETKYVAMLDDVPIVRNLSFDEWWSEPVFVDNQQIQLSRKELVRSIADQDGGAHVDPALNDAYSRLSRQNSLGWVVTDGKDSHPIPRPERAAIRQVAHEVLKTLKPDYAKQPEKKADIFVSGMMMHEGAPPPLAQRGAKIGRNEHCFCGSGKKYKKCHGTLS